MKTLTKQMIYNTISLFAFDPNKNDVAKTIYDNMTSEYMLQRAFEELMFIVKTPANRLSYKDKIVDVIRLLALAYIKDHHGQVRPKKQKGTRSDNTGKDSSET